MMVLLKDECSWSYADGKKSNFVHSQAVGMQNTSRASVTVLTLVIITNHW